MYVFKDRLIKIVDKNTVKFPKIFENSDLFDFH